MFTLLCAISIQILKFFCKDRRLLLYMSRTLHLFGTDWCAMMVPIQVIRWYRMQCYDGTDSCATVVPIRRYCHLTALCETFFVYETKRYNIKGKQLLKTLGKYYLVDIGLRRMLLGSRSFDAGRILENIVYLELLHRQQKVYIGKMDNLEVDFVAIDENNITYYQVAATVRDETTLKRELASLQQINDQYPKYILTLDEDPTADYNGIKRINALRWLMGEIEVSARWAL